MHHEVLEGIHVRGIVRAEELHDIHEVAGAASMEAHGVVAKIRAALCDCCTPNDLSQDAMAILLRSLMTSSITNQNRSKLLANVLQAQPSVPALVVRAVQPRPRGHLIAERQAYAAQADAGGAPEEHQVQNDQDKGSIDQLLFFLFVDPCAQLHDKYQGDASTKPGMPHHEEVLPRNRVLPLFWQSLPDNMLDAIRQQTEWHDSHESSNEANPAHLEPKDYTGALAHDDEDRHDPAK
mmetsp:Transcript_108243/g.345699  ORF Transcript_108243/g.345699 Transcript_108243/m.345699 type:complete len:237 (+) Transcript_108243:24-734(+)